MNNFLPNRRVVVTGLGVVSALGIGQEVFWDNLIHGKSGISRISSFDSSHFDRHFAAEVKDFEPAQFMTRRKAQYIGRSSQMAIAASKLALKDADLKLGEDRTRVCVSIGTTTGEIALLEKFNDLKYLEKGKQLSRGLISVYPASSLSMNVARELKITGKNILLSTACAAGNYALGFAFDLIRLNKCDIAIVGGADPFSRIVFTGFSRLYAIAPEKCQPFDKNRKGMIPGEGAGILILESLENALKRKTNIYSEVLGYGLSCNANHMTDPSEDGISKAIKKSLASSNISIDDVDYISAHGTGTIENDRAESFAFHQVFSELMNRILVSSIKSMLGHSMGAASAFESIACCLAIKNNRIPPTINFETKDDECNIDCVPNQSRAHEVKVALNNSYAFGGNNACVAFGKVP